MNHLRFLESSYETSILYFSIIENDRNIFIVLVCVVFTNAMCVCCGFPAFCSLICLLRKLIIY